MGLKDWGIFSKVDPSIKVSVRLAYANCRIGGKHRFGILVTTTEDVYSIRDHDKVKWLGVEADQAKINEAVKIQSLCGKKLVDIKHTDDGIVVLTKQGRIYEWKNDEKPQLVSGCSLESQRIIQIASGYDHCLALTSTGHVYGWGRNNKGQLGIGSTGTVIGVMKVSFSDEINGHIQSIACGMMTSYAVDKNGKVWSWGSSESNSLGYHSNGDQLAPKEISDFGRVQKVTAGGHFAVAPTNQNEAYYWGEFNEGIPRRIQEVPKKMSLFGAIVDIAAIWTQLFCAFQTRKEVNLFGYICHPLCPMPFCFQFPSIENAFQILNSMVRPLELQKPKMIRSSAQTWKDILQDPLPCTDGIVKFKVDDQVIPAYKGFLMRRNDYFRSMFENNWDESRKTDGCIEIPGLSAKGFKSLIYFLYTDELMDPEMEVDDTSELLRTADFYQVEDLHGICADMLKSKLHCENACTMYAFSVQCNAQALQLEIVELAASKFTELKRSEGFADMPNELKSQLIKEVEEHAAFKKPRKQHV